MVSDAELVGRLREVLRASDLSTTTTTSVRRQLEEDFGIDLSDKKAFIRQQVDLFLSELHDNKDAEEAEEEEEDAAAPAEAVKEEEEEEDHDGSGEEEEEEEEEAGGIGEVLDEEEGDEGEEEDEKTNEGSSKKRKSSKPSKEVKKRGGGFAKLCSLSPLLQDFVGEPELARTEVVKRLWAYIREKNLQDPNNRRKIICDEKLKPLFNVNVIDMFQMNKALSKHIWPLNSDDGPVTSVKPKQHDKPKKELEGKRQKVGSSGLLAPLPLSDDLVKFFGTGENTLSRSDVVKRMWDYIKGNNLQDPADKRNVICDEKLKELLKVDSFHGFTVSKLLAPHFIKEKQ